MEFRIVVRITLEGNAKMTHRLACSVHVLSKCRRYNSILIEYLANDLSCAEI